MQFIIIAVVGYFLFRYVKRINPRSLWTKTSAAGAIQYLLSKQQSEGLFDGDAHRLAEELVGKAWATDEAMFDGKVAGRPHKVVVAAISLAYGARRMRSQAHPHYPSVLVALHTALTGLRASGGTLPLTALDHKLLQESAVILSILIEEDGHELTPAEQQLHDMAALAQ